MESCAIFKIESEYARFNKHFSSGLELTYLIIHPLAVRGLMGSLLGFTKEKINKLFHDIKVGIQVLAPVQKERLMPVDLEYLKNPRYRIFLLSKSKLKLQQLVNAFINENTKEMLLEGSPFTVKIEFEEIIVTEGLPPGLHQVSSVIPVNNLKLHWDKAGMGIHLEYVPVKGFGKNEYLEFKQVLFRSDEKALKGIVLDKVYQVGHRKVYFF